MLRFVASGPFPAATEWGRAGAVLGLVVHFALMAIMATRVRARARRWPALARRPAGWRASVYGLITYVAMNWIVVPLRFDSPLPPKADLDRHSAVRAYRPGRNPDRADHRADAQAQPRRGDRNRLVANASH